MAIPKLVTENDIGKGLKIENQKLVAMGIKTITVDKAQNQLVVTSTEDVETRVELPAQTIDVKLQGAEVLADSTTLRLTLTDNTQIDVDLAKFLNIDTDTKPTAFVWDGKVLKLRLSNNTEVTADFATLIDDHIKGEEARSIGGERLGYFVKLDQTA